MSETQNLKTRNKELEKVLPAVKTKQKKKKQLQEKLGLLQYLLPFLVSLKKAKK